MKAKITIRSVEAAVAGSFLWDTELQGFGLKVTRGGKKVFLVQKRPHKGAKTLKRWSIGAYPAVSPIEARTRAKTILGTLTLGRGVSPVLRQSEGLFKDEIEKFYQNHILLKLKVSTARDMDYMIRKHLIPEFGATPLGEVSHLDVRSFHSRLGSKHPYRANRVLALLSKFYAWSGYSPNPCKGVEKFREKRRELNQTCSLEGLFAPSVHPAIRLLLLTGMRKNEVLSLRWEDVSLRTHTIQLSDSKTGGRTIYLSRPALEVLEGIGPRPEGWCFPSTRGEGHLIGLQKIWKRTLSSLQLPSSLRLHDLRHHYASRASQGLSLPLVKDLLGHKDIKTTVRYIHSHREDLALASTLVSEKLFQHDQ